MRRLFISLFPALLLCSCGDEDLDISHGVGISPELRSRIDNIDLDGYRGLEDVFLNSKDIYARGRPVLLIFGSNGCSYCEKLKEGIKADTTLKLHIAEHLNPYYVNISYAKNHSVEFLGGANLVTHALARKFDVSVTPTIVFIDSVGLPILRVSGFPGMDTFSKMVDFTIDRSYGDASTLDSRMQAFSKYLQ